MTNDLRWRAARLLAVCASGTGETLRECAEAIDERPEIVLVAGRVLAESLGCGNWRAVRAEAEARLRTGKERAG